MTHVTFEDGYRRLQGIAERLNSDEVPVHEMCDLFAEGTGLHQALSGYLREQKARVEAIERGEGVQLFRIVAPSSPAAGAGEPRATSAPEAARTPVVDEPRAALAAEAPRTPSAGEPQATLAAAPPRGRAAPPPEASPARDAPPPLRVDDDIPF